MIRPGANRWQRVAARHAAVEEALGAMVFVLALFTIVMIVPCGTLADSGHHLAAWVVIAFTFFVDVGGVVAHRQAMRVGSRWNVPEVYVSGIYIEGPHGFGHHYGATEAVAKAESIRQSLPPELARDLEPVIRRMIDFVDLAARAPDHEAPAVEIQKRLATIVDIEAESDRMHTAAQVVDTDDSDVAYAENIRVAIASARRESFGKDAKDIEAEEKRSGRQ